jgi:hypothetical protein
MKALELFNGNKRILIKQINTMNTNPEAYIALNNNRHKIYGDIIYLKDGDEFQIELFNPLQVSVLAKIWINNQPISDVGLVIRPGQRYFLDRYIDNNVKFKFNTYTVDPGNTSEVLESIKNNGSVKVEFYPEKKITTGFTVGLPYNGFYSNGAVYGSTTTTITSTGNVGIGTINPSAIFNISGGTSTTSNANYSNTIGTFGTNGPHGPTGIQGVAGLDVTCGSTLTSSTDVETGRIEMGSTSHQHFSTANINFELFRCAVSEWKILPDSHRAIATKEIRNYCSECGTRIKKQTWKFCPNCGNKS